ncbi:hypothetical protein [Nesterenkonia halotolerans]|uniref:Asp23/Gls24 family envelope stress response protein n=1 Tax=Nesterenkonia halotolerans TaxID=225325 RepID=A0ABR9J9P9_9MICC|nr:hypothetical protein [Nesterenkonia halotolerans]MBE1515724.1 hypothetical protein [Nesterenkonia halotolerans]
MDETATPSTFTTHSGSTSRITPDAQRSTSEAGSTAPVTGSEHQQYDQMAKAAAAGLMAHQHVDSAMVEISGTPDDLVFHLHCTIIQDVDPSAVMELVSEGIIPNVERMLGEAFVSRDLKFSFAPEA